MCPAAWTKYTWHAMQIYHTLPQGYALTGAIYVGNYRIVFFIKYLHRVQCEKYYENSANKCEFLLPQAMSGAVLLVSPVNSRRIYTNKYMKVPIDVRCVVVRQVWLCQQLYIIQQPIIKSLSQRLYLTLVYNQGN